MQKIIFKRERIVKMHQWIASCSYLIRTTTDVIVVWNMVLWAKVGWSINIQKGEMENILHAPNRMFYIYIYITQYIKAYFICMWAIYRGRNVVTDWSSKWNRPLRAASLKCSAANQRLYNLIGFLVHDFDLSECCISNRKKSMQED